MVFITIASLSLSSNKLVNNVNPIQDGPFRGCSRMGGPKKTLPKISHTYPTMMKLDILISYLKKIQKIQKSRDTLL